MNPAESCRQFLEYAKNGKVADMPPGLERQRKHCELVGWVRRRTERLSVDQWPERADCPVAALRKGDALFWLGGWVEIDGIQRDRDEHDPGQRVYRLSWSDGRESKTRRIVPAGDTLRARIRPAEWEWKVFELTPEGERIESELSLVPAGGHPATESVARQAEQHSPDFRSVHWRGTDYTFATVQAECVKVMWEAWEAGTPAMAQATILTRADSDSERLSDVFSKGKHPAWGTMIVKSGKGMFGLAKPK
jgi:hypothetical protein